MTEEHSHRLEVLQLLTAHLQGITVANGYTYELSSSVFRGRMIYGDDDPIPMLSIIEATVVPKSLYASDNDEARKDEWPLMIQGWATDDHDNPTDPAYRLMAAVERRLYEIIKTRDDGSGFPANKVAYMLGNKIANLRFGAGTVRPPTEQVSSKAFFYLPVKVTLATVAG